MAKRANNEGTISQRTSDKRWIGQIYVPDGKGGKLRKCVSDKTQSGCKKKLDEIKKQLTNNTFVQPVKLTFGKYLDTWLEQKEKLEKLKITTLETHKQRIETHIKPALGKVEIQKITISMLNNFYTKLTEKISAHTVRKVHAIINNCFRFAKRDGLIIVNPAADALLPRFVTKQKQSFKKQELINILKAAKEYQEKTRTQTINAYTIVALALNTGMRRGELAGLRWEDVDLEKQCIHVKNALVELNNGKVILTTTKTESSLRTIYISLEMISILKNHKLKATGTYVFPAKNDLNKPMSPNNISRIFRNIVKSAGLNGGIHLLRHSHITQLLEAGVNIKTIKDRAGHSNISTTIGYCSPDSELDKQAAAVFNDFI